MMQSWSGLISAAMGVNCRALNCAETLRRTIQNATWFSLSGMASPLMLCSGTKLRPSWRSPSSQAASAR